MKKILTAMIINCVLLTGCVSVSYQTPEGASIEYVRFGSTKMDGLDVKRGDAHLKLSGYSSENADMMEAVARGAVQGATK